MLDNGNTNPNDDLDLIILDYKHGNDLIERNAMTLVALIQRLNATYGTNYLQEITLIGPSMGSLVAQYALTYMENKGIPHRVKTFISFDGDYQGANVPIGLQNYIEYITRRGILKNIKSIRDGLYNGYGAKQQLAHHHSANSEFPEPDALRKQFLLNLSALSPTQYPQLCRKVAIINGTNTGKLNPERVADETILKIEIKRSGWKNIWGLCNDDICKKIKWVARTSNNNGTNKVAEMWTASPLYNTLFWVPLGKKNTYAQPAWGNSALDNAPGGLFGDLFSDNYVTHATFLAKELIYLITGDKPNFEIKLNNFTIMPSYCAADLQFPNKNLYLKWDDQYLCGKTPFDYIYAPSENEEHVFVSAKGSLYFENEIRCNTNDLPIFIKPTLTGVSEFCGTSNYSLESCKPLSASSIVWTAVPTGVVTITGTGNLVSLSKLNDGIITLTASTPNNNCGNGFSISKTIVVGNPKPYIAFANENPLCINMRAPRGVKQVSVYEPVANVVYRWRVNGTIRGSNNSTFNIINNWCILGTNTIRVESFKCGNWVSSETYEFEAEYCSLENGRVSEFVVSPNPVSSSLNILPNPVMKDKSKNLGIKEIIITDKQGLIVFQQKFTSTQHQLSIPFSRFKFDLYYIKILNGKQWETLKFSKE